MCFTTMCFTTMSSTINIDDYMEDFVFDMYPKHKHIRDVLSPAEARGKASKTHKIDVSVVGKPDKTRLIESKSWSKKKKMSHAIVKDM